MSAPLPPTIEASDAVSPRRTEPTGLARLGAQIAILALAVALSVLAIVAFIPEANDYARASELKHRRLADIETRKLVLVGGSNLSFGIDSTQIQKATGCPVVNMGMNGYLGVRFMLEEVKAQINPTDVVVVSFEYDNLFKTVDGSPTDHLAIIKAYPSVLGYLSLRQKLQVASALPLVAQKKITRLMDDALAGIKPLFTGRSYEGEADAILKVVETWRSFSPEGDLLGHLGHKWPYAYEQAVVPKGATIDPEMIALMHGFAEDMQKRGVPVIVSYPPFMRDAYDKLQGALARYDGIIKSSPPLIAPSPPSAFAYDENMFFDTVYHLNERGRPVRTKRLIDDLASTLGARARCP